MNVCNERDPTQLFRIEKLSHPSNGDIYYRILPSDVAIPINLKCLNEGTVANSDIVASKIINDYGLYNFVDYGNDTY